MDVKGAVQAAKGYVAGPGFEQVEFNAAHGAWRVTLGLSRPWDVARSLFPAMGGGRRRSHKAATIADQSGKVLPLKNWIEH